MTFCLRALYSMTCSPCAFACGCGQLRVAVGPIGRGSPQQSRKSRALDSGSRERTREVARGSGRRGTGARTTTAHAPAARSRPLRGGDIGCLVRRVRDGEVDVDDRLGSESRHRSRPDVLDQERAGAQRTGDDRRQFLVDPGPRRIRGDDRDVALRLPGAHPRTRAGGCRAVVEADDLVGAQHPSAPHHPRSGHRSVHVQGCET